MILGPEEGTALRNPVGGEIVLKLLGADSGGAVSAMESRAAPGEGPPLHTHADAAELIYIVEGSFRFNLDGEVAPAPAGSIMFVPRGVPHTWQNAGHAPGRLVAVFTPAAMEGFFRAFAQHAGSAAAAEAFVTLGREAQMEVAGPPLARSHPLDPSAP